MAKIKVLEVLATWYNQVIYHKTPLKKLGFWGPMVYPMAQKMAKAGHLQKDFPCDHWKLVAWRVSFASKRGMFGMMPTGGAILNDFDGDMTEKATYLGDINFYCRIYDDFMYLTYFWFYIYIMYQMYCDICGMPLLHWWVCRRTIWIGAVYILCCVYYNLCSSWWGKKSSNHNLSSWKFRDGKVVECILGRLSQLVGQDRPVGPLSNGPYTWLVNGGKPLTTYILTGMIFQVTCTDTHL